MKLSQLSQRWLFSPTRLCLRGVCFSLHRFPAPPFPAPDPGVLDGADVVTFTSASTVSSYLAMAGEAGRRLLGEATVAAIGPITAGRLSESGFQAGVVPDDYTIEGLVDALVRHLVDPKRA